MTNGGASRRWAWAAFAALTCVLLGDAHARAPRPTAATAPLRPPTIAALGESGCPRGTAPDGNACVHLEMIDEGQSAEARPNTHHERSGRITTYEQIPRLPDRPADYDAYRYPIPPGIPGGHYVISGYDLDKPDEQQRRGAALRHVGHGAVDLPQLKGTPIELVPLEHQDGDAEVLYTGPLFGLTVVTRHSVRESGRTRDYVVLFGHLDTIAPGVTPGVMLHEGSRVGTVGDSGSPRLVHLHLEVRRVRDGIDPAKIPAGPMLVNDAVTVVCDPRNVLPLK